MPDGFERIRDIVDRVAEDDGHITSFLMSENTVKAIAQSHEQRYGVERGVAGTLFGIPLIVSETIPDNMFVICKGNRTQPRHYLTQEETQEMNRIMSGEELIHVNLNQQSGWVTAVKKRVKDNAETKKKTEEWLERWERR